MKHTMKEVRLFRKFAVAGAAVVFVHVATADVSLMVTSHGWHEHDFQQVIDAKQVSLATRIHEIGDGITRSGQDGKPYAVSSHATATGTYGVLKVAGSSSFTGAVAGASSAHLQLTDTFTLHGNHPQGAALIHYTIKVDGSTDASFIASDPLHASASVGARSEWTLQHYMTNGPSFIATAMVESDRLGNKTQTLKVNEQVKNPYGMHSFVATVTLNAPTYFYIGLLGQTQLGGSIGGNPEHGVASASYDLGNSVYWGGISQITALDGTPLDVALTSASGTNYIQSFIPAVPEPAAASMLLAGLFAVGAASRHARRHGGAGR